MTWQDDIRDNADALTDSYLHREPIHYWDHSRHRRIRHHITRQPGLLAQLHNAVTPTTTPADGQPGGGKPGSRPPLAIEALSTHDEITAAVRTWCTSIGLEIRPRVESNLRQLAAKAMSFDEPTAHLLISDLRRWRRWCLVMTGWEHVRRLRGVTCPHADCQTPDSIRVNLTTVTALCRACGQVWSEEDHTIGLLAQHATAG
jgi:hypothetical protein